MTPFLSSVLKDIQMKLDMLVEMQLGLYDWTQIREANGTAASIPIAFRELLESESPNASVVAYWKLENHVVVQGSLFQAARCLLPAICAALVDFNRAKWVRVQLLELLYQLVAGVTHPEELTRGTGDLAGQCKAAAREGIWTLYRIYQDGELRN